MRNTVCLLACAALLAACGNKPRQPDWLVNASGSQERYERAYLSGRDAVANAEFARLRSETSSTGDPRVVARAELTRCAMRVASLDFAPCAGFEPLRLWFTALYEVLLGQSQGPRFGSFAAIFGLERTIALIERALAGELVA